MAELSQFLNKGPKGLQINEVAPSAITNTYHMSTIGYGAVKDAPRKNGIYQYYRSLGYEFTRGRSYGVYWDSLSGGTWNDIIVVNGKGWYNRTCTLKHSNTEWRLLIDGVTAVDIGNGAKFWYEATGVKDVTIPNYQDSQVGFNHNRTVAQQHEWRGFFVGGSVPFNTQLKLQCYLTNYQYCYIYGGVDYILEDEL